MSGVRQPESYYVNNFNKIMKIMNEDKAENIKRLPDWQIRLQVEQQELSDRIDKLEVFLHQNTPVVLDPMVETCLRQQMMAMIQYAYWLTERMRLLEIPLTK